MAGFDNDVVYGTGIDLSGGASPSNKLNVNGYIYMGNASGNPVAGLPSSSDGSMSFITSNGLQYFIRAMKSASTGSQNVLYLDYIYVRNNLTTEI